ncbi:MAG: flagellin [Verrucomicrobia bacterium]|nr:flagellin [Verrucomicrobiota bacterium]
MIDQRTKAMYDEEFGEIQKQLGQMADAKWNGISLFSVGDTSVLFGGAPEPHNLNVISGRNESVIAIQRSEIFDKFKIIKSPTGSAETTDSGGRQEESRTTIELLGSKGTITWWQWPHSKPDHFKVIHGSEVVHEKAYGNSATWPTMTLANGTTHTVTGSGAANQGNPLNYKDVIRFGDLGNQSSTLTLLINESGQTSNTGWEMQYQIEYDPYPLDLADKTRTWSLKDFDMTDFETFQDVLTTARAQNGAEQSRIKHELDELQTKQVGLEQALESADGLDYSLAMARYSKSRDKLHFTVNLVSAAREMETVLYTDFLNE